MSAVAEKIQDAPAAESEKRPKEFDVAIEHAIERIRKRNSADVELLDGTPCFAILWRDEHGVCPNDGVNGDLCALRVDCESAYTEAQARISAATNPPEPQAARKSIVEKPPRRRMTKEVQPERHKWRDTTKYQRLGYQPQNRPVDRALELFVAALGDPPTLPRVWSPIKFHEKYGGLGPIVMSRTVSYTSVLANGQTIVRCWTNAGNCMIVDVIADLVEPISRIKGSGKIHPVPAGSVKKLRPCTHRFELAFGASLQEDVLGAIGALIRMAYRK